MGPRDPKDVAKYVLHDLMEEASELRRTKADAEHWLTDPEYGVLLQRLEDAHAAVKEALMEAERRVRANEERLGGQHPRTCISIQPQIIPTASSTDRTGPGPSGRGITWLYPKSCK